MVPGKGKQDQKLGLSDKKGGQGLNKQHSEAIGMRQGQMLRATDDLSQDKFLMGTMTKGANGKQ